MFILLRNQLAVPTELLAAMWLAKSELLTTEPPNPYAGTMKSGAHVRYLALIPSSASVAVRLAALTNAPSDAKVAWPMAPALVMRRAKT